VFYDDALARHIEVDARQVHAALVTTREYNVGEVAGIRSA
jgi:hypothetical protein